MRTASIRDLRTRFPEIRRLVEQEGEVVVTDRGRPVFILRTYQRAAPRKPKSFDYYGRLKARMPVAISAEESTAIDEANRGER